MIWRTKDKFGRTLKVIIAKLEGLGYMVSTKVLNGRFWFTASEETNFYCWDIRRANLS